MGVHNIKLESEVFQAVPQFQIQGWTPVETKPEYGIVQQLISQLAQVNISLNQMHQTLAAQGLAQWHIPNRTPVETKIDPTVSATREGGQWNFPSRTPVETKVDPTVGSTLESAEWRFPNRTPIETKVETKVDTTSLQQIVSQVAHLQEVIGQISRSLAGQAFTRAAEGAVEGQNLVEKVRKLNRRGKSKGKEAGAKAT